MNLTRPTFLLLACFLLFSCTKKQQEEELQSTAPAILELQPGDYWVYKTSLESRTPDFQLDQFPSNLAIKRSFSPNSHPTVSYEETHTYEGRKELPDGATSDVFEVHMGDTLSQIEFNLVEGGTYFTLGFQQLYPEENEPVLFGTPVPLVDSSHVGGEHWEMKAQNEEGQSVVLSEMRVISHEELSLSSGTFHCLHIQSVGPGFPGRVLRDVWFAPGVGLIKDRLQRFDNKSLVLIEERELVRSSKLEKTP